MADALGRGLAEEDVVVEMPVAEEIDAARHGKHVRDPERQRQPLPRERGDGLPAFVQKCLVVGKEAEVIAVAGVVPDAQFLLHETVEFVEVEIPEPLRGIVADGDVLPAGKRVDDFLNQP